MQTPYRSFKHGYYFQTQASSGQDLKDTRNFSPFKSKTYEIGSKTKEKKITQDFLNKIMHDLFQTQSSSVKIEGTIKNEMMICDDDSRQQIVKQFIQRQQFKHKESLILKQMEQFCEYGAIRTGFH